MYIDNIFLKYVHVFDKYYPYAVKVNLILFIPTVELEWSASRVSPAPAHSKCDEKA